MNETILSLSWQIQVALASGYAGYLLAYIGIRDGHRSIDTAFVALVFSVIASGVLAVLSKCQPVAAGAAAFIATCAVAVLWRGHLRSLLHRWLHNWNVSWSDDTPSAWAAFHENNKIPISQIAVELDNGTWLRCDGAADFNDAPFGPAVLGVTGDIALYLTHIDVVGADSKIQDTVRDPDWGDRITYVPASRIRCITMRFKHAVNRS